MEFHVKPVLNGAFPDASHISKTHQDPKVGCFSAGDEFHLVHIIKDETEKLREYYQEKSLGTPHPNVQAPLHANLGGLTLTRILVASQPITSRATSCALCCGFPAHPTGMQAFSARLAPAGTCFSPILPSKCMFTELPCILECVADSCVETVMQKTKIRMAALLRQLPQSCLYSACSFLLSAASPCRGCCKQVHLGWL